MWRRDVTVSAQRCQLLAGVVTCGTHSMGDSTGPDMCGCGCVCGVCMLHCCWHCSASNTGLGLGRPANATVVYYFTAVLMAVAQDHPVSVCICRQNQTHTHIVKFQLLQHHMGIYLFVRGWPVCRSRHAVMCCPAGVHPTCCVCCVHELLCFNRL